MALETLMKYKIEADASKAKAEIASFDRSLNKVGGGATHLQAGFKNAASEASNLVAIFTGNKLTGITSQLSSFGSALGAIPGPAGLAAGAIAGVGAAGLAAGAALYGLTKAASDYGSIIHDAAEKAGTGAETISALKIAADQSSTSIEAVTGGIAKFAKTVGAAGDGSAEAAKKIKAFGIDPKAAVNDLDGALGKVFAKIVAAKPGIEQITLAQKAFGKAGAELIPMINSFDGDLPGLIAHMKELGLTMTDKDAKAADEFGDQMDTLTAQVASAGRAIGFEFMPIFLDMAKAVSGWLSENKGEIRSWGTWTADIVRGIAAEWDYAAGAVRRYYAESRAGGQSPFGGSSKGGGVIQTPGSNISLWELITGQGTFKALAEIGENERLRAKANEPFDWATKAKKPFGGFDPEAGGSKIKPPKETDREFRQFFNELGFNVVRTFGEALNKNSPHTYGGAADISIKGKNINDIFVLMAKSLEKGYRVFDERLPQPGVKQTGPHIHVENAKTTLSKASDILNLGFSPEQLAFLRDLDKQRLGKTPQGQVSTFATKQKEEAEKAAKEELEGMQKALDEYIQYEEKAAADVMEIRQGEANLAEEILKGQLDQGEIDEKEYADRVGTLRLSLLNDERDKLLEQVQTRENIQKLTLLDLSIAKQKVTNENIYNGIIREQNKLFEDQWALTHEAKKVNQRPGEGLNKRERSKGVLDGDGMGGGIGRGMGVSLPSIFGDQGIIKSQADYLKSVYADVSNFAGGAIGSMTQGLADMGAQWLITGEFSGKAALQMLAASALHIATEAGFKAIFEVAEGYAALATTWGVPNPSSIAHFTAAGVYGTVAGIAGGAGVGLALGARAMGGSGGGGGGTAPGSTGTPYSSSSSNNPNAPLTPQSRTSSNAYLSGGGSDQRLASALETFNAKVEAVPPGHVFMKGMAANRGEVGRQAVRDVADNHAIGRDLIRTIGVKNG